MADIIEFKKNLFLQKSNYLPMAELGIHPEIKSRYIGRQILSIEDEIEFW